MVQTILVVLVGTTQREEPQDKMGYKLVWRKSGRLISSSKRLSSLKAKRKRESAKRAVEVVRGVGRVINRSEYRHAYKAMKIVKVKR